MNIEPIMGKKKKNIAGIGLIAILNYWFENWKVGRGDVSFLGWNFLPHTPSNWVPRKWHQRKKGKNHKIKMVLIVFPEERYFGPLERCCSVSSCPYSHTNPQTCFQSSSSSSSASSSDWTSLQNMSWWWSRAIAGAKVIRLSSIFKILLQYKAHLKLHLKLSGKNTCYIWIWDLIYPIMWLSILRYYNFRIKVLIYGR